MSGGIELVERALERARAAGAHTGDALLVESDSLEARVRGDEIDFVKQARERTLGIRVFVEGTGGLSSAITSTSDLHGDAVDRLADRLVYGRYERDERHDADDRHEERGYGHYVRG